MRGKSGLFKVSYGPQLNFLNTLERLGIVTIAGFATNDPYITLRFI